MPAAVGKIDPYDAYRDMMASFGELEETRTNRLSSAEKLAIMNNADFL